MGTSSPLRKFLQSLCCNSCWNYAVFWKLHHQSQMLLTWEDGYCDTPKQRDSTESILDDSCFTGLNEMSSCNFELSAYNGALSEYTVGQAVAYMANAQYAFGDGVVGDVAYTGNYRWVFPESISSGFNSKLVPEHPEEWLFQFAAGIKTILLVPVVPHGVLQLGSVKTVAEDLGMVAHIKDEFVAHQNLMGYSESFAFDKEFLAQSSSLLTSGLMENMDEFSSLTMNGLKSSDSMAFDDVKLTNHKPLADIQYTSTEDDLTAQLGMIGLPEPLHHSLDFSELGMIESRMCTFLEEEFPSFSYSNNLNTGMFGECAMKHSLAHHNDANNMDNQSVSPFLSFPKDCELHKALGPAIMGKANGVPVSGDDAENLLDPSVVESVHLDENSSSKTTGENSPTISSTKLGAFAKGQNQTERSAFGGESTLLQNHVTSSFVSRGRNLICSSSPAATSYESVLSELIEDEEQKNRYGYPQQKKGSKLSGASKRRGKPGDKQKARPRDRQLIQDRLKELRELVPNGAKCSIDGLLDRTVAHMLFLKSVSDRADKLRQWVHPEGAGRKNMKSPENKDGSQNGASWAFELGSDQEICPIVVEDLEDPGNMIIEMICDENGRFLEIAEVIHGLDLTILKGGMDKRLGNTWAHFVIEAPRGLRRLDIFWPLMKLLQQHRSSISSKI